MREIETQRFGERDRRERGVNEIVCEPSERDGGMQREEKEKWVDGNCKDLGREIVYERERVEEREREITILIL